MSQVPADHTTAERSEARLRRIVRLQRLLFEVSREIGPALELQPVLDTVLSAMRQLVEFKGGSICLVEGDTIRLVVSDPPVSQEVLDLRLRRDQGLSGHIVTTGKPLYSPNVHEDPRTAPWITRTGSNASMRSYIGVPLMVLGDVIGLLQVDSAEQDAFDEDDLYVLEGLGVLVAGAIESARRHEAMVELERLKSDFIERVSHELRTPITIMSGFTDMLIQRDEELPPQERAAFIDRIRHATARLRYLVEEVVTLTSLDAGPSTPAAIEVALVGLVEEAARHTGSPRAVTVAVQDGVVVRTDPTILSRVIQPIIDNAVKYGERATVSAERVGDRVVIDVDDQGPGVDPKLGDRIFDRFVRGRHTVEGMGLGLAIARHLGLAIDASIEHVRLDDGCRFRVVVRDVHSRQPP